MNIDIFIGLLLIIGLSGGVSALLIILQVGTKAKYKGEDNVRMES